MHEGGIDDPTMTEAPQRVPETAGGKRRVALITGASAGIGAELTRVFARNHFDLVLTSRREDRLKELAGELERQYRAQSTIVPADLTEPDAPRRLFDSTKQAGIAVDVLVNNAGYGLRGAYAETAWSAQAAFLRVMAVAVTELCYLYLPGMVERGQGRILNVASVAGLVPGSPGMALYSAIKAYLIQFSQSLHAEYEERGIAVCVTCPGFTRTEFQSRAQMTDITDKRIPNALWMRVDDVAEQAFDALMRNRSRHVPGLVNKAGVILLGKVLPRRLSLALARSQTEELMVPAAGSRGSST